MGAAAYAYHKVVFKRFCDTLPRAVDDLLLRGFLRNSKDTLISKLGIMSANDSELTEWFEEDSVRSMRRSDLQAKVERQRKGIQHLDAALQGCAEDGIRLTKRARLA